MSSFGHTPLQSLSSVSRSNLVSPFGSSEGAASEKGASLAELTTLFTQGGENKHGIVGSSNSGQAQAVEQFPQVVAAEDDGSIEVDADGQVSHGHGLRVRSGGSASQNAAANVLGHLLKNNGSNASRG